MILAIDPSIAKPGWAVLRVPSGPLINPRDIVPLYVDSGCWFTESDEDPASRLSYLAEQCAKLCDRYPPTRAFVEEPPITGVYSKHKRLAGGGVKSAGSQQAILGGGLAQMQRSAGVFLAVLGSHCPTAVIKAGNPGLKGENVKDARRRIVSVYWPHLNGQPEDEIDAIYLGLTAATDSRRKWAA
jgi:hypothetical protein